MKRKELKKKAKGNLKKHYWLLVIVCIFLTLAVNGGSTGSTMIDSTYKSEDLVKTGSDSIGAGIGDVYDNLAIGNLDEGKALSENIKNNKKENGSKIGILEIAHSRGVLADLVNNMSSGMILVTLFSGINSIVGQEDVASNIFVILSLLFMFLVWMFIFNVFKVACRRFFLETRTYDTVPISRLLYLHNVKKWSKVACSMLLKSVYQTLWDMTIIGGVIKHYSYFAVPYVVAENPDISPKKAITFSRKMMYGHKWECFKLEFSFVGWYLLSLISFGILEVFFVKPYEEMTYGEYYAYLRKEAIDKNVEGSELLNDTYLFEKADPQLLREVYNDKIIIEEEQEYKENLLERILGVVPFYGKKEEIYRRNMFLRTKKAEIDVILEGKAYPRRLFTMKESKEHEKNEYLQPLRHYSITSVILMFFTFSMVGWLWEVSLHLISDGEFVNRGVLQGPWLPIYGSGGILILLLLYHFRRKPWLEFILAVILAGTVEYYTSLYLEMTHNGQKWWDYTGYFLNLNGRVCAEGLFVFGLGGMAIVYFLAPLLDNLIRKIPFKILVAACACLLVLYTADQIYSSKHPNTGKGITDYAYVSDTNDSSLFSTSLYSGKCIYTLETVSMARNNQ